MNIDGIWYKLNEETKEATVIRSYNIEGYRGRVVIPEVVVYGVNKYTVTSIGDDVFINCFNLTSITIPDSVISIGDETLMNVVVLLPLLFQRELRVLEKMLLVVVMDLNLSLFQRV